MTADFLPGSVPQWPAGLSDDTPLPFAAWRVMNLIDGRRSVQEIASSLGLSLEQTREDLQMAHSWLSRVQQQTQVVTDEMLDIVTQCLMSVVGPMGEFIVDDAADAAGEQATLAQVLSGIAKELDEQHLHAFARLLRSRGLS